MFQSCSLYHDPGANDPTDVIGPFQLRDNAGNRKIGSGPRPKPGLKNKIQCLILLCSLHWNLTNSRTEKSHVAAVIGEIRVLR